MECVFDITLGMPMNAYECAAYEGHWCEYCGEDNGGGKFCYECGKKASYEPSVYGDDDDLYEALVRECDKKETEDEDYDWICPCGNKGGYCEDHYEWNDEFEFTYFYCCEECFYDNRPYK